MIGNVRFPAQRTALGRSGRASLRNRRFRRRQRHRHEFAEGRLRFIGVDAEAAPVLIERRLLRQRPATAQIKRLRTLEPHRCAEPGIVAQPRRQQRVAYHAVAVYADRVFALKRGLDLLEIGLHAGQIRTGVSVRQMLHRKIDGAAGGLPDRPRLLERQLCVGRSGIAAKWRIAIVLEHHEQLQAGRGDGFGFRRADALAFFGRIVTADRGHSLFLQERKFSGDIVVGIYNDHRAPPDGHARPIRFRLSVAAAFGRRRISSAAGSDLIPASGSVTEPPVCSGISCSEARGLSSLTSPMPASFQVL